MNLHIRPNKTKRPIFLELKVEKGNQSSKNYFDIKFIYPNANVFWKIANLNYFQGEKAARFFHRFQKSAESDRVGNLPKTMEKNFVLFKFLRKSLEFGKGQLINSANIKLDTNVVQGPISNLRGFLCWLFSSHCEGQWDYKFTCRECDNFYAGETSLLLSTRVEHHKAE